MNILNDYPYRIEYKSRNEPMRIKKGAVEKRAFLRNERERDLYIAKQINDGVYNNYIRYEKR